MPFVAKNKRTNQRIDITQIEQPRLTLKSEECVCQLCDLPMIVKSGLKVQAHFAHKVKCTSDYETHPESPEHLAGKRYLIDNLKNEYAEYTGAMLELEVKVPEVKRIADVMATFANGWKVAHEIQLAGITIESLQQRTDDYGRAGVDVVWWLGRNANTPVNREWCYNTFGFVLCLNLTDFPRFSR